MMVEREGSSMIFDDDGPLMTEEQRNGVVGLAPARRVRP